MRPGWPAHGVRCKVCHLGGSAASDSRQVDIQVLGYAAVSICRCLSLASDEASASAAAKHTACCGDVPHTVPLCATLCALVCCTLCPGVLHFVPWYAALCALVCYTSCPGVLHFVPCCATLCALLCYTLCPGVPRTVCYLVCSKRRLVV